MEGEINKWLKENDETIEIVDTQTAACTVGNVKSDLYQYVVATVWYKLK